MPQDIRTLVEKGALGLGVPVLLGKGSSLDGFLGDGDDHCFLFGINEVAAYVPCHYVIYSDDRQRKLEILEDRSPTIIRPWACAEYHSGRGYCYHGRRTCTAASAIRILAACGHRNIVMVGFDAWDSPTGQLKADTIKELISDRGNADYARINVLIQKAIDETGIEPIWYHRKEERETWQNQRLQLTTSP